MTERVQTDEDLKLSAWLSAALSDDSVCQEMKDDIENWFGSFNYIGTKFTFWEKRFTTVVAEVEDTCSGCAFNQPDSNCPDRACENMIFKEITE